MEYLGLWVTRNEIQPVKKLETMVNMTPSNNVKQVRAFLGLVNYYRDMWKKRLHLIQPLAALTSTKLMFRWTDFEQKAFDEMK